MASSGDPLSLKSSDGRHVWLEGAAPDSLDTLPAFELLEFDPRELQDDRNAIALIVSWLQMLSVPDWLRSTDWKSCIVLSERR